MLYIVAQFLLFILMIALILLRIKPFLDRQREIWHEEDKMKSKAGKTDIKADELLDPNSMRDNYLNKQNTTIH